MSIEKLAGFVARRNNKEVLIGLVLNIALQQARIAFMNANAPGLASTVFEKWNTRKWTRRNPNHTVRSNFDVVSEQIWLKEIQVLKHFKNCKGDSVVEGFSHVGYEDSNSAWKKTNEVIYN